MSLRHASLALHMKSKRKLWLPAMGADSQRRSTPEKQNFLTRALSTISLSKSSRSSPSTLPSGRKLAKYRVDLEVVAS